MPLNEQAIEAELQAKGLSAPRLTPDLIDECIVGEAFHVFPGTTLTICALTLRNGYVVTGESAAASPENFNRVIGEEVSRSAARAKIWGLEGYLLREKLHELRNGQKPGLTAYLRAPEQTHAGNGLGRRPHP